MESNSNTRIAREESLNSRQSVNAAEEQRPPPAAYSIETDPDEPSSWEEKEAESTPGRPKEQEPEIKPMEVELPSASNNEATSSRKKRNRAEVVISSSSSEWSQDTDVRTELTQRSENLLEMNRTIVRLRNLQSQMAVITEQYTAKMARLLKEQEECSITLWRQQQLQGELQVKYAEVTPQEMSSNGRDGKAPVEIKSEEASTGESGARSVGNGNWYPKGREFM